MQLRCLYNMSPQSSDYTDAMIGILSLALRREGFTISRIKSMQNEKTNLHVLEDLISAECITLRDGSFGITTKGGAVLAKLEKQYNDAGWKSELNSIKEAYL